MFSSVSRPPSKTTKAWCLQALFFFFSPRVSRALLLKLPIISDMQSTYVPWISQAFSLSLHQEESSIDSNFSLSSWAWTEAKGEVMGTRLERHEAAENEQMSLRQEDICR